MKDVVGISLIFTAETECSPARFCRVIAEEKINLPCITCIHDGDLWGLNIIVDSINESKASRLIEKIFGKRFTHSSKNAILSIFPHKNNPLVTGSLFEIFDQEGIEPTVLATSPSAISVVLREDLLNKASKALFEPFRFSAYRTPADWKLAQKGKEQLYKEVVASYQEQRPKVYGLEYHQGQELMHVRLKSQNSGYLGTAFNKFARMGLNLTFLATSPSQEKGKEIVAFGIPQSENHSYAEIINGIDPDAEVNSTYPVAIFSMNGPHFGDRYGIVSELFTSLEWNNINLLGLSCTIASITGAVPSDHLEPAINAIRECFEVPSIAEKA